MSAPLLILNQGSSVPPYEQISLQIRTLIASGQLKSGDRLPSVRQLASDLDVAPNTVVRAYSELENDGWVVTSARRGVMVAPQPPVVSAEERTARLGQAVHELLVKAYQLGAGLDELHFEIDRQAAMMMRMNS